MYEAYTRRVCAQYSCLAGFRSAGVPPAFLNAPKNLQQSPAGRRRYNSSASFLIAGSLVNLKS